MEVQHTPAAVVAASGGMVLQQHIEDNQERTISMMCTHLQIEPSDPLTDDLTSYPEFMKVLTTVAVACKDQHFYSTLCGRGEGVSKKSTLCTLAKRLKIVDHP